MGHLWRRLRRNLGGVTKVIITDLIWRRKNLLTIGGVGVGLVQLYTGVGFLLAGSFVASFVALLLAAGGLLAGSISFFGRPASGGVALALVIVLAVAGPGVVFGIVDTAGTVADDSLEQMGAQPTETTVNDSTPSADGSSYEDGDRIGSHSSGGDTADDGCGTNDGDPSYNEDNDRDNDGLCDE